MFQLMQWQVRQALIRLCLLLWRRMTMLQVTFAIFAGYDNYPLDIDDEKKKRILPQC
jgi:hypothetical protein